MTPRTRFVTVLATVAAASLPALTSANGTPEEAYRGFHHAITTATRFAHLDTYLPTHIIREREQTLGVALEAAANSHISRADMERALLDAARPDTTRYRLGAVHERPGARALSPEGVEHTLLDVEIHDMKTGDRQHRVALMARESHGWVIVEEAKIEDPAAAATKNSSRHVP